MAYTPLIEITFESTLHRVSLENLSLINPWDDLVISQDALQYRPDNVYGGYVRLNYGSISLSYELFENHWPPPVTGSLVYKLTDSTEAAAEIVFSAYLHRAHWDRNQISYDLYGNTYEIDLLSTATDYDGNEDVPLPRAFGNVTHVNPIRLPDVNGQPTYHKGHIVSNFHVYDDGVNIDANVTDNNDGTFSLSAVPVGEVTMSGTGEDTSLVDIFDWAAAQTGLSFNSAYAESPSPNVSFWANSQDFIFDALSPMAAFFTHFFYIKNSTLYLFASNNDVATRTVEDNGDNEFFPPNYYCNPPTRQIKATWQTREAVEESIGKYVKTNSHETVQSSNYHYGEKLEITPYTTTLNEINTRLSNILTLLHKPRISVPLPMIVGNFGIPKIGEKITLIDTALGQNQKMIFHVREITYNTEQDEFICGGEGQVSTI